MTDTPRPQTEVVYNAECPVCRFEIDHYRAYASKSDLPIRFHDLNAEDLSQWGLTQDQAARRLYVRQGDELVSGIPAFVRLWKEMPRYRWLARIISLPGIFAVAALVYDHVLAKIIYSWHLRRSARAEIVEKSP